MDSPDFDHTKVTNTPQPDPKTDGLLTLYLMKPILMRVPEKTDFGWHDELAKEKKTQEEEEKEVEELEKRNERMVERWKDEADKVVTFVCAGSTILCIFRSK